LCAFTDRVPEEEREHVLAHLPSDVRVLSGPVRRRGASAPRPKTVAQLVEAVIAEGGIDPAYAEPITRAVIAALRRIVRDEARDIAAVLPTELRRLWDAEPVSR
jgi:uncharacterized protein (DUF2267 family)